MWYFPWKHYVNILVYDIEKRTKKVYNGKGWLHG